MVNGHNQPYFSQLPDQTSHKMRFPTLRSCTEYLLSTPVLGSWRPLFCLQDAGSPQQALQTVVSDWNYLVWLHLKASAYQMPGDYISVNPISFPLSFHPRMGWLPDGAVLTGSSSAMGGQQ
jgi:hypothetical protein